MSDLTSHTLDDVGLPCDVEPSPAVATSEYLNRPCRSLIAAIRDISAVRDLPMSYFEFIRPKQAVTHTAELFELSAERVKRARR